MSIKNAIRRLETKLARISGCKSVTFQVPHCKEPKRYEEIQRHLIAKNELSDRDDMLIIFVVDFSIAV
jgi:hypothetical protein